MSDVPSSPSAFFTTYLPSQLGASFAPLAGKSSPYAITIAVPDAGAWTLRLSDGKLLVEAGADTEALLTITLRESDFDALFAEPVRLRGQSSPSPESQIFAWKALGVDAQKAKLVRAIPGSMAFVVADGDAAAARGSSFFPQETATIAINAASPRSTPSAGRIGRDVALGFAGAGIVVGESEGDVGRFPRIVRAPAEEPSPA